MKSKCSDRKQVGSQQCFQRVAVWCEATVICAFRVHFESSPLKITVGVIGFAR